MAFYFKLGTTKTYPREKYVLSIALTYIRLLTVNLLKFFLDPVCSKYATCNYGLVNCVPLSAKMDKHIKLGETSTSQSASFT